MAFAAEPIELTFTNQIEIEQTIHRQIFFFCYLPKAVKSVGSTHIRVSREKRRKSTPAKNGKQFNTFDVVNACFVRDA